MVEFPGTVGNLELPASRELEELVNTVLLAPSHADAVDGIYQILTGALVQSYLGYVEHAHPVHDAPTVATLQDIVRVKEQQRLWLRDYRRRHPHKTDPTYAATVSLRLDACGNLREAMPATENPASPVGVNTDFRLPAAPNRPDAWRATQDFMPFVNADFTQSIEARRLFWCYGYLLEMGLAEDQLRWIYDSPDMPWEFTQDVARHLWDESRHGDSGHSRLLDFGITIEQIGFTASATPTWDVTAKAAPLTAKDLYDAVFFIGMCAETSHFPVKHEAYADFRDGGDLESAEMVLFDIIDETSHVQYARKWLPLLAERAGIAPAAFKTRGPQERARYQERAYETERACQKTPRDDADPNFAFYQGLLQIMRDKQPLTNAETCPRRTYKPM